MKLDEKALDAAARAIHNQFNSIDNDCDSIARAAVTAYLAAANGAWHPQCAPVIRAPDGTILARVS